MAHASRCACPLLFWLFFPHIHENFFNDFSEIECCRSYWIENDRSQRKSHDIGRNKQYFNLSLVLWNFLKRMKTLAWIVHCVEAIFPTHCFCEKWKSLFNTKMGFSSLLPLLCYQDIGSEESEINKPQSFLFIMKNVLVPTKITIN